MTIRNSNRLAMAAAVLAAAIVPIPAVADAGNDLILDLSHCNQEINYTEKGFWDKTYSTAPEYRFLDFGPFRVSHIIHGWGGMDVGDGMSYWDGFTLCNSGDTTDYGELGSSDGWVPQQWGVMAGGGILADHNGDVVFRADGKPEVKKGIPYLVGYWGYWIEEKEGGAPACQITMTDGKLHAAKGIYVCNHPWPYYGNIHGDGFARAFTEPDDSFVLYIHGLDENGKKTGAVVRHVLANTKENGGGEYTVNQDPDWNWVDLSTLGDIGGIYFTQTSTDSDPLLGMNTACYFCIDKLTVGSNISSGDKPARPTALTANASETSLTLEWQYSGQTPAKSYNVYIDNALKCNVFSQMAVINDLEPYTFYNLGVEAVSENGKKSDKAFITAMTTDETAPDAPANIRITQATPYSLDISWDTPHDNVAVTSYDVYVNGTKEKRNYHNTSYLITGLDPDTEYAVEVEAMDAAGNKSQRAGILAKTDQQGSSDVQISLYESNSYPIYIAIDGKISAAKPTQPGVYIRMFHGIRSKVIIR